MAAEYLGPKYKGSGVFKALPTQSILREVTPSTIARHDRLNRENEAGRRYYDERDYRRKQIADQQRRADALLSQFGGQFGGGTVGTAGGIGTAAGTAGSDTLNRATLSRYTQENVAPQRQALLNAFQRSKPRPTGNLAYDKSIQRERFAGLSSGLSSAYGGARQSAIQQYAPEFQAQVAQGAQTRQNAFSTGMARFQAANQMNLGLMNNMFRSV